MINANIKKKVTDAIRAENTAGKKWVEAGNACRAEYTTMEALTAVRAEFLDAVIYPAMGDDAVRVMRADVPRAGGKEDTGASTELRAQWAAMREAKKTIRGKGSVYFGRVLSYAFPDAIADKKEPAEKKDARGRIGAKLGEAQTMVQKLEAITAHDKVLLVAIAAWQAAEAAK
jgi:hypothetical protein